MKQMKKWLALALALALLLTFTACGEEEGGDTDTTPTGGESTTATTTTTAPTTGTTDGGLLPDDQRDGSKDLPFEIGGVLEFDAVVKAYSVTYYDVYRVNGTILTIKDKNVMVEYEGKTYDPKNGVVSFAVDSGDVLNPVKLAIGNTGDTDATFKVTFTYPEGTKMNPIKLKEGDLVTTLKAGNEQGLVYLYTATASGTLTIVDKAVTKGVSYDVSLLNLNTSASRTLGEDGVEKEGKKTVSVEMNKGDKVEVTIAALPDDNNEYPAATIKTQVAFATGEVTVKPVDVTYSATVKDDKGAAMSGVKLSFNIGGKTATATTDKEGVATVSLPAADGVITVTIPEGYNGSFTYVVSVDKPSVTIVLEKEQPVTPPTNPTDPEQPEVTTMDYTVTVLDAKGEPAADVVVRIFSGDREVAKQTTDKNGGVSAHLERGNYTVKLENNANPYDEKAAVLSVAKPDLTLSLGMALDTSKSLKVNDPLTDKNVKMYYLPEGATYVTLTSGSRNYFLFEPTRAGTFRFSSSNTAARIGHFGTDMFVYTTNVAEVSGNAFNISVNENELGNIFVIALDATCDAAVVQITRIGDPAWSIENEPTVEYKGSGAPKPVTAPTGLTNLDIFSATQHHLVYSDKDGYYHLDSASGPVVYVQLDSSYVSIQSLLTEFGNMTAYLYNADGTFKAKEQYAGLMQQYVENMDKNQKVYPLTKDLKYMIENFGNSQNWWNAGEPGYLFEEVEGVNADSAWMFLYCYKK